MSDVSEAKLKNLPFSNSGCERLQAKKAKKLQTEFLNLIKLSK